MNTNLINTPLDQAEMRSIMPADIAKQMVGVAEKFNVDMSHTYTIMDKKPLMVEMGDPKGLNVRVAYLFGEWIWSVNDDSIGKVLAHNVDADGSYIVNDQEDPLC